MYRMVGCLTLILCAMTASLIAQTSASGVQTPADCTDVYQRFLAERKGPEISKYRTALTTANEYLSKCSSEEGQEKIKEFVAAQIPRIKETIRIAELVERFDRAALGGNIDEAYSSGRELIPAKPGASLDIMITLASMGYENATAKASDKYDSDTARYAKLVIDKLNAGEKSEKYGFFRYHYATAECSDGKTNTIGWMNYAIGMTSVRQKNFDDAVPYLYQATQTGCETKSFADTYRLIGKWYLDSGKKIDDKIAEKLTAAQNQETDETRALEGLLNGYLERSMDAYFRAYKLAKAEEVYKKLQDVYSVRFRGKTDGMDQYLAKLSDSPFPNPKSEVKPVVDPPPAAAPMPVKKP